MCAYSVLWRVCNSVCVCVRAGVHVHEPANHKLIEAIRELAEQRLIATPDGQAHGVNALRTFKKTHASSCAPPAYMKANSFAWQNVAAP